MNILTDLKNDKEPTEEEWNALFSTPGYRALMENEFDRDFFKNNFTVAFMPSKAKTLKKKMNEKGIISQFLQHYVYVKKMYRKIPQLICEIKTKLSVHNFRILEMAGKYLPKDIMRQYEPPTVAFVIFGYDSRGYSPVVVDLVFAEDIGTYLIYLIAHEIHHFYRNKIVKLQFPSEQKPEFYIIWLLNQMEAEGIADLIDKPYLLNLPNGIKSKFLYLWKSKFSENLKKADGIIKKIDEFLAAFSEKSFNKEIISDMLKYVPMSGHITGYYMATAIWEVFGEKIISCVGDPYRFMLLYNEAAESLGKHAFSDESIDLARILLHKQEIS